MVAGWTLALGLPLEPWSFTVLLGVLLLYDHHTVHRWRSWDLLASGVLLAAGLGWTLTSLLSAAGLDPCLVDQPWLFLMGPLPGHLLATFPGAACERPPVRLEGPARARRLAREALLRTPGCRFRPARPGEVLPAGTFALSLPRVAPGDRRARVFLPDGRLLPLHPQGPEEGMGRAVRRTMDLLLGSLLLVLLAPLIGFLALLIRRREGPPAFHAHSRITQGGRVFTIHKLRTMVADAEPGGVPVWPQEQDPRITSLGLRLRHMWLDELPQLIDVLRGHMSLVGPRPERPRFAQAFAERFPNYPLRHQVKAGMTGWAQIKGLTGNTPLGRRLHMDLRYVARWSPLLDLRILGATAIRMLVRLPGLAR